jgi:hypothetical protein
LITLPLRINYLPVCIPTVKNVKNTFISWNEVIKTGYRMRGWGEGYNRIVKSLLTAELPSQAGFSFILWDITTCRPVKVSRRFGGTYRLHLQGQARNLHEAGNNITLAYSSTLKMGAICFSETSIGFHRTNRRYVPEITAVRTSNRTTASLLETWTA